MSSGSFFEPSYVYAPHVPLQVTRLITSMTSHPFLNKLVRVDMTGQYNVANKQSMYSGNFDRSVTVPANTIMTVLNVFSYEDPSSVKLKIMNIRFLASSNVHSIVEMEALDYDF